MGKPMFSLNFSFLLPLQILYSFVFVKIRMTDGIEKFEITDWDIENEFNPNRVKHNLTKKQQIYGVFASDSEEEEERPGFGLKGSAAFHSHINFISGGVRTVGEKDETKKEVDDEASSSEDEAPAPPKPSTSYQRKTSSYQTGFSGVQRQNQLAGLRSLSKNNSSEFGSWEKHTKGIGQKLLLQMGYEPGKGLGKKLQGITTPIEAKLRKGKGAIGLYGPECGMKRISDGSQVTNIELKEEEKPSPHQRQWKKKPGEIRAQVKYIYRTAEDVMQDGSNKKFHGDFSGLSSVKVIDMTGPEQRILSGYHQIHQQHSKPQEQETKSTELKTSKGYHFSLPELEHNLKLLEEEEKKKIIRSDHQKRFAEDQIVNLGHEEERLLQQLNQEEKQFKTLEKVLKIITSLEEDAESEESNITLEIAAKTFKQLQEDYYEEYKLYNLSDLCVTIVMPLVKKLLDGWDPLTQIHHCIDIFKDWKDLLESNKTAVSWNRSSEHGMDPYHQLIWNVWLPPLRRALLNWNVRNWSPLVQLLETWQPLLPPWILTNVLEQLVLPRLQSEVESWNPLTDTIPVHSWLHPWLPLMGSRLEPLYAPIRHKLASALVNWHPSDCSAKLILEPWKSVFARGVMDAFIINNIVPKLVLALQGFIINPNQQHLDVWNWVMAWSDMIPEPCMVSILEKNFFPKWLQVLYTWLTHNPNYEEVTKWFTGWKSMLPPSLHNSPIVKEQFKQALDIMNRAVSAPQGLLGAQPGAKESIAYLTNVERQQEFERHVKPRRDYEAIMQTVRGATSTTDISLSFKELIQKKAEESNILFMPVPGRFQEGKQVHRFGNILLYLDRGVILVYNEKTWVPTSLQSLLDRAG